MWTKFHIINLKTCRVQYKYFSYFFSGHSVNQFYFSEGKTNHRRRAILCRQCEDNVQAMPKIWHSSDLERTINPCLLQAKANSRASDVRIGTTGRNAPDSESAEFPTQNAGINRVWV